MAVTTWDMITTLNKEFDDQYNQLSLIIKQQETVTKKLIYKSLLYKIPLYYAFYLDLCKDSQEEDQEGFGYETFFPNYIKKFTGDDDGFFCDAACISNIDNQPTDLFEKEKVLYELGVPMRPMD